MSLWSLSPSFHLVFENEVGVICELSQSKHLESPGQSPSKPRNCSFNLVCGLLVCHFTVSVRFVAPPPLQAEGHVKDFRHVQSQGGWLKGRVHQPCHAVLYLCWITFSFSHMRILFLTNSKHLIDHYFHINPRAFRFFTLNLLDIASSCVNITRWDNNCCNCASIINGDYTVTCSYYCNNQRWRVITIISTFSTAHLACNIGKTKMNER